MNLVPEEPRSASNWVSVHVNTAVDPEVLPSDLRIILEQLATSLRQLEQDGLSTGATMSYDFRVCTAQLITECRPRIDVTVTFADPGRVTELDDPQREQLQ